MNSADPSELAKRGPNFSIRLGAFGRASLVVLALATASCQTAGVTPPRTSVPPPVAPAEHQRTDSALAEDTVDLTQSEVTSEAVRIFGDSIAPDSAAAPDEPSWDIDVRSYETHSRVEFYVNLFKGAGKDRFSAWLTRGSRYNEMIRRKLREGGLPEDMTYLALIESGYNPHAYSRAAAVGMW
ncbi:MAG: hypothetical protein ACR2G6_17235, partial [Gemmatimonadaceae bacterium]